MPNSIQFPGNKPIILKDLGLTLQDLGFEVHIDVGGTVGKPIFWNNADGTNRMILFLHPIDFYWTEYGDVDPAMAHTLVMDWLDKRLDDMAEQAINRINTMYVDPEVGA